MKYKIYQILQESDGTPKFSLHSASNVLTVAEHALKEAAVPLAKATFAIMLCDSDIARVIRGSH